MIVLVTSPSLFRQCASRVTAVVVTIKAVARAVVSLDT
jgi:hypothetical protein